jgi:hypothetical protein
MALCGDPVVEGDRIMTRGHRAFHRMLWPALALVVGLGFTMAFILRPPPETPAAAEPRR